MVFGGVERSTFSLQYFNKTGGLDDTTTSHPETPGYMNSKAFVVRNGIIYTEGRVNDEGASLLRFDGFLWIQ